jgi:hypothetical protein
MRRVWAGLLLATTLMLPMAGVCQARKGWRQATPAELEAVLPARATVEKERIETEMRTASGAIDGRGRVIAAVVLITAGYAANGKYSHYLLLQAPVRVGTDIDLPAGAYVIGWTRAADGLAVHLYEAETGVERGAITAKPIAGALPVVSIKVWPPGEHSIIQIGRFSVPYKPED